MRKGFLKPFSFGEPHVEGHLPTLEALRNLVAGLRALGTTTPASTLGRLTTTDTGLGGLGARAGRRLWTFSGLFSAMSVDLLDRHEVPHGGRHAADLGTVLFHNHVTEPLQPEGTQGFAVVLLAADVRLVCVTLRRAILDTHPGSRPHRAAGATSSSGRPRRAAISSGRIRP